MKQIRRSLNPLVMAFCAWGLLGVTTMNAHAQDGIDHNVLLQIETAGITPSPEAEKATLARRLFIAVNNRGT